MEEYFSKKIERKEIWHINYKYVEVILLIYLH